jgi:hypothetical protein
MCCSASCNSIAASAFRYQTILVFNERLKDSMSLEAVLAMMSLSSEFENMMVR